MDPAYWQARWDEGRIGFHEGRPNALLSEHVARLGAPGRVLVPLCGKAEDMAFLAERGHEVVGIDLVERPLREFCRAHALEPEETKGDRFTVLRAGAYTLLAGDVLDATAEDVGPLTAVYDRAAIVALPEETRTRYVARLRSLLPAGSPVLVVSFDYPESAMEGPPFSVGEQRLRGLFAGASIELLGETHITSGKIADAGVEAKEQCWLVTT